MNNYNVVETTKVSGRCFDFIYDEDIENGSLIAKGELVDGERNIYKAKIPSIGDEVFLVANPAWDYDDCRTINQNEENFINKAGKPFRAYGLVSHNHDKFGVEDYGITATSNISIGDYVTVDGTTVKINDVGNSAPTLSSTGFVGKIVEIENYGFSYCVGTAGNVGTTGNRVIIEVVKNATVES
jgi:hypothetical protein